jgi:hypothetical protein
MRESGRESEEGRTEDRKRGEREKGEWEKDGKEVEEEGALLTG